MSPITGKITSIEPMGSMKSQVRKVILELPHKNNSLAFKAGQYLEIILPDGKKCPFSIAKAPLGEPCLELHVRPTPDSRDSEAIEELLGNHSDLQIEFPKGDCYLDTPPKNDLILIAASTGITQMKSIIEFLLPLNFSKSIHLYWGVLKEYDLYLAQLCDQWSRKFSSFNFVPVVSEADSSNPWKGRTGLVGNAVLEDFDDLSDVTVYVSGGPAMVYATLDGFVEKGMPEGNMNSDVFSYAPRKKSG